MTPKPVDLILHTNVSKHSLDHSIYLFPELQIPLEIKQTDLVAHMLRIRVFFFKIPATQVAGPFRVSLFIDLGCS